MVSLKWCKQSDKKNASHVRKRVEDCQIGVQDKRIDNSQITPELLSTPE